MTFLPKDLTPAQRAGLKLFSHFVLIGIFNALLAGYSWFSNNAFSWHALLLVVGAQAALAILDAAKKYFTAQGDLPFSSLIELARLDLAQHTPAPAYTPAQQSLQQSISSAFAPINAPAPAQTLTTALPAGVGPTSPFSVAAAALVHPLASPAVAPASADLAEQTTAPRPVVAPAQ